MSEPRARNSYRFEIHIFFLPRSSVDEPSRVRGWSRPSGSLFTKSVTKSVASVTKSPTAMTTVTKKRGRPAANGKAMTPAEKQRAFRERRKAKD
jgi:hypothetical protein